MKRREFIQTVAALGAGAALPGIGVVSAPPASAAAAVAAAATPVVPAQAALTFFVDALGNLSFGNEPAWQRTRAEVLGLCRVVDRSGLEALKDEAYSFSKFASHRRDIRRQAEPAVPAWWNDWIRDADESELADEIAAANAWMLEEADAADLELADNKGLSERGATVAFFDKHFPSAVALGITFVDGEHFEWAKRAAVLGMSVDDANALAAARNIPIRFEPQVADPARIAELKRLAGESREPDQGEVSGTMPPDDGETHNPTPPGVERHPLYDHPRIAAVREAIHGIGVSNEYKARLYHSLYAYADQVVTRPICAPGEGWSDLEAIQQVTMGDMNERWIRTNWFHSPCEPASGEDETTSHGHDGVTAQIGKHQEGTVETGVASSVLISPAYPTELEPVEPPKPPYPRLPDWGRPLINATTRGILSKEYVHACEYNYFVLRRTTPAPRSVKEASPEAQFLIAEAWEMLRSRGLDDSGRPLIRPR